MWRLLFLATALLVVWLLAGCSGPAPASTPAQSVDATPEITVYKSPT